MPLEASAEFPVPQSWEELESIVCELLSGALNDPSVQRNGRSGQAQHGVDIFGRVSGNGGYVGTQVKSSTFITEEQLRQEVERAKSFKPALSRYILAFGGKNDARLQEVARLITLENEGGGLFSVEVWSWDELARRLADVPELLRKYYPQFYPASPASYSDERDRPRFTVTWPPSRWSPPS